MTQRVTANRRAGKLHAAGVLLIFTLLGAACGPATVPATPSPVPDNLTAARSALLGFFDALNEGRYAEAIGLYGGSYELLTTMNPDADPNDLAGLWEQGCLHNGFQCLRIKEVVESVQQGPNEYRFKVRFEARTGGTFVLGPCCGASETEQPSESLFEYLVARAPESGNTFRVQDLPVYMP